MAERVALIASLIAFLSACVGIMLRLDRSLFVLRIQFSLRTLLIAVTAAGMTCGFWARAHDAVRNGRLNFAQMLVLLLLVTTGLVLTSILVFRRTPCRLPYRPQVPSGRRDVR